ncbi:MAG: hypothetical protein M1826_003981 [Phylliscum demangeonii]|nr:MAG: hypothetical protein M1826_003981 [Phylliscum demangeonii]
MSVEQHELVERARAARPKETVAGGRGREEWKWDSKKTKHDGDDGDDGLSSAADNDNHDEKRVSGVRGLLLS